MNIKTERCTIVDLSRDMIPVIQKNSLDDDNRRFVPDEVFETIEDTTEAVEWLIESDQTANGPHLYPVLNENGENIGYVQACQIPEGWEVGYHIAKQYTGKGYATEAVKAFLPVIMKKIGISRIYGEVLEENKASIKVLEKLGFVLNYQGIGQYQGVDREIRQYIFDDEV